MDEDLGKMSKEPGLTTSKNDIDEFKNLFNDFLNIHEKNKELCPWFSKSTPEELLDELKDEIRELEESQNKKNREEELGDILWDYFLLVYKLEEKNKINKINVIKEIIAKIKRRKPYLFSNKSVSLEEAHRIWYDAKNKEKYKEESNREEN
ncbi:MAG: hypothetical protein GWP09_01975 [Nitrospiraceae bacterium]|nr:hypothetical protein [Nitrospiraceae bacterium]